MHDVLRRFDTADCPLQLCNEQKENVFILVSKTRLFLYASLSRWSQLCNEQRKTCSFLFRKRALYAQQVVAAVQRTKGKRVHSCFVNVPILVRIAQQVVAAVQRTKENVSILVSKRTRGGRSNRVRSRGFMCEYKPL